MKMTEDENDYGIIISDYDKPVTRAAIVLEINKIIKRDMHLSNSDEGIEIDVDPGWDKMLNEDPSIFYDYEKAGWKVIWLNIHSNGPGKGKLKRSWLKITEQKNKRFVKQ